MSDEKFFYGNGAVNIFVKIGSEQGHNGKHRLINKFSSLITRHY